MQTINTMQAKAESLARLSTEFTICLHELGQVVLRHSLPLRTVDILRDYGTDDNEHHFQHNLQRGLRLHS